MNELEQMKLFMEPKSVAIIGVSRRTGPASFNIVENMLALGFGGRLYPVNPNINEVLGLRAYPSVRDIPEEVDLAVIVTPREVIPSLVRECTEREIRAIIVVSQGFADANDDEGKVLQAEIVRIAREGGARILGPNTLGTANAFCNFSTTFIMNTTGGFRKTPVAVICQTGVFFFSFPELGIGKMIDLGNSGDIDFSDALTYLQADPQTKVIAMHIEGLQDGGKFLEVASGVSKPIIAMKTARSEPGRRAAQSHTCTLAGRDESFDAAFKRCGIIRVSDLVELEDICKTLLYLPPMQGSGLGIMSFSGAGGIMALDACHDYGLEIAELENETIVRLRELVPSWHNISNPVDIWPAIAIRKDHQMDALHASLRTLLADQGVHALLFIGGDFPEWDTSALISAVAQEFPDKPIVYWLYTPDEQKVIQGLEGKAVVFPSCKRAVNALSKLWQYSQLRSAEADYGNVLTAKA